jgi:hypothetical protein
MKTLIFDYRVLRRSFLSASFVFGEECFPSLSVRSLEGGDVFSLRFVFSMLDETYKRQLRGLLLIILVVEDVGPGIQTIFP